MMQYKLLGKSGLRVSELCLGTMTFGEDWGWGAPQEECKRLFETFTAAGGNFIDTANNYTNGSSERIVGELVAPERDRYVIATKYSLTKRPNDPNGGGNHRKNLMQSVNASLKNLRTDYIDLLWLHAWDFMTPVEEIMRGLDDVVRAGKVHYVGISDAPAWEISRSNMLAELRGWSPFVALQTQYSLVERTSDRDLLPMAEKLDLAVTAWGALGAGLLSGKYNPGVKRPASVGEGRLAGEWGGLFLSDRNLRIAEEVSGIARATGKSSAQIALAWVRQREKRVPMIPILGVKTLPQLQDNLGALEVTLSSEQLAKLEAVSKIELGFPHEFLTMARGYLFGETFPRIKSHR